jgi:hypothetical protein
MRSRLKYRINMWHNKHVNVWHFSRDIVCSGRLFRYHVLLTFIMEAVYGVRILKKINNQAREAINGSCRVGGGGGVSMELLKLVGRDGLRDQAEGEEALLVHYRPQQAKLATDA